MNNQRKVIISTESACELPLDVIKENDIRTIQVRHYLDGEEMTYSGLSMDELYEEMQKGKRLTTSQVNEFEYMEHFETAGIFLEIVDRAVLSPNSPEYVHLEEHIFRVCVFQHHVIHCLAFHFLELMAVIVVAEFDSTLLAQFAYLVKVFALCKKVFHRFRHTHPRANDIFHSGSFMVGNTLFPPLHGFCKIAGSKFLVAQAAVSMGRKHLEAGLFAIFLKLLRSTSIEFAIVIICGFYRGITHIGQIFQQLGIAFRHFTIFVYTVKNCTQRVKLDTYFFLWLRKVVGIAVC